ncbi:MAG: L-aspartate oxidase, partial [Frankia sp.]|nr:L-aspartate oxidase [Frankia sp.]
PPPGEAGDAGGRGAAGLTDPAERGELARVMTDGAGVLRGEQSLRATAKALAGIGDLRVSGATVTAGPEAWEMTNLRTVAAALVAAAAARTETRGSHWREDHAERDDAAWRGHLLIRLDPEGVLDVTYEPLPGPAGDGALADSAGGPGEAGR